MDYPRARDCGGNKRKREDEDQSFDPPDDGASTGKGGGGDRDGDGNGDPRPSSSERNTKTWLESVEHFLPIAMKAYETTIETRKPEPHYETSSDWRDPFMQTVYRYEMLKGQTFAQCDVEVVTCDEDRNAKTQFS